MSIEKRRHPKISVKWRAVFTTPQGSIEGETSNISVGGAFIRYSETPDLNQDFQIVLIPDEQKSISVTCTKAWSGSFNIDGKETFSGMGVRFTEISPKDLQFISTLETSVKA